MLRWISVLAIVPSIANAGPFWPGAGVSSSPPKSADCSQQKPTNQKIPAWSRLSWSVAFGTTAMRDNNTWKTAAVIVPQLSAAIWAREGQCAPGTGLFTDHSWRRVSLAFSSDITWRNTTTDAVDVRPALRLSRATYQDGFLTVGSSWVPSFEMWISAGPTFDPAWSGGAVSLGATVTVLSVEVRATARTQSRGQEVMFLAGITDLHGLFDLGDREWNDD